MDCFVVGKIYLNGSKEDTTLAHMHTYWNWEWEVDTSKWHGLKLFMKIKFY